MKALKPLFMEIYAYISRPVHLIPIYKCGIYILTS